MVDSFILSGVTANNILYTGDTNAIGCFSHGSSTNLGLNAGIVLTTGIVNGMPPIGDTVWHFSSNSNGQPGDTLLESILSGYPTYDAAVLEFDLVPTGNVLEFQYVFASEEYPEFVNTPGNDIFGFFISGINPEGGSYVNENIALIPGSNSVVCIDNVNAGLNSSYFVDNETLQGLTIVFDGFTTVLTAQAYVVPDSTYHLKMAIADRGDDFFDSGIFLNTQSLKSYTITNVNEKNIPNFSIYPNPICAGSKLTLNMLQPGRVKINITDITGKEVYASEITLNAGIQQIPLDEFNNISKAGIYLIHIQTDNFTELQKLVKY